MSADFENAAAGLRPEVESPPPPSVDVPSADSDSGIFDHGKRQKTPKLVMIAAGIVVIWGVGAAHTFLIPLLFASLLALLMMPLIRMMKRRRFPEWLTVISASLILIAPVVISASLLVTEGRHLAHDWPRMQAMVTQNFNAALDTQWAQSVDLRGQLDDDSLTENLGQKAGEGLKWALLSLTKVFSAGSQIILVLFFAIVMIASRAALRDGLERIIRHYQPARKVATLDASAEVLEKFLAARLLIILFVAVADFIILKCFGFPYSATLSLVLGVMTLVPVLGFFVGVVPVILVGLARGETPLLLAAVFLSVGSISSLQDHILAPKLIGRRLNLNFLMTYVAIFAGERLWGISGMFLGVPILGVVRILLNASDEFRPWGRLLEERTEQDPNSETPPPLG